MLSFQGKKWLVAEPCPNKSEELALGLTISPVVAKLMVNRGIDSVDAGKCLIEPDLKTLHDPFLMLGMREAVDRIVRAIEDGEKITVFGDYDVDGVTSAAFCVHFFRELGIPFSYYLPDRMEEGYGLNEQALDKIKSGGSSLVITADCGITAVEEVKAANAMGLDVIITDHHQVGEQGLPPAVSVLNPHQPDCEYPFRFLSGVGLVFKLATAVRSALYKEGWDKDRLPNLKKHLDLLVLGTIADVAPLVGENHVLCSHGLAQMTQTLKPGLIALKSVAGLNGRIDARSIGFGLGPRLNAAGRMGKADAGLHLLTCTELNEARGMAHSLDKINQERQEVQKWSQEEAEYLFDRQVDLDRDRVIVLASENFHKGVIGIIAAKFVQKYYRPTVLIALENGEGKGSARSIKQFNLFKAFENCREHLARYGGHAYAAGLNIIEGKVDDFRKAINEVGTQYLKDDDLIPDINVDTEIGLDLISLDLIREIHSLEPFGQMNPLPIFVSRNVSLKNCRFMGRDGSHVRFQARMDNAECDGIAFHFRSTFECLNLQNRFDLVYELQINNWNGKESPQMKLLDLRESQ